MSAVIGYGQRYPKVNGGQRTMTVAGIGVHVWCVVHVCVCVCVCMFMGSCLLTQIKID